MIAWAVEIVLYGLLVGAATRVSWRHPLGLVGLTMCLCAAVTNIAYFGGTLASRVTLEIIQAIVITNSGRIAFAAEPNKATVLIIALAALDVAFCAAIAISGADPRWLGFWFGNVTNALFALQCLCVAAPGIRDAYVGRFRDSGPGGRLDHAHLSLDDGSDWSGR